MKITKRYEVWVGGDLIDDILDRDEAVDEARQQFEKYGDEAEIVIDEIIHYHIETLNDLKEIPE
jgi:hypothetical protein